MRVKDLTYTHAGGRGVPLRISEELFICVERPLGFDFDKEGMFGGGEFVIYIPSVPWRLGFKRIPPRTHAG
jgi:hypothetical protein